MGKASSYKIEVTKEEFKKIKKGKQTLIIRLNDEEIQRIKKKDKVVIKGKIDRFKKEVKGTYIYPNLDDLINSVSKKELGYKKKDITDYDNLIKDYKKEDIKKYGILGIELKPKKHVFRKILLGILILVLLFSSYRFVKNKIDEINVKKINNTINELAKKRIDYVFVEINPSFVLTIKDNKVNDVACLNDDCVRIYNDINIKGKNINDSIDTIYNVSKEKGFNVSNGVKIKTSSNVSIEVKDHITIEHIDSYKAKELLKEVKNNEGIKNVSNDDYYTTLWKKLKEDSDYGSVYSCNINSSELYCSFTEDFMNSMSSLTIYCLPGCLPRAIELSNSMKRVLDKFDVKYSTEKVVSNIVPVSGTSLDKVFINGNAYTWGSYHSGTTIHYDNVLMYENNDIIVIVPFAKLNLLTSQYNKEDAIIIDEWAY